MSTAYLLVTSPAIWEYFRKFFAKKASLCRIFTSLMPYMDWRRHFPIRLCTRWDFKPMAFRVGFITRRIKSIRTTRMPPMTRVMKGLTISRKMQINIATTASLASWMYSIRMVNTLGTSLSTSRNTVGISAFR